MCVCDIFFILHISVDTGCLHILVIVCNAAGNMVLLISFLDTYPEVGLLYGMVFLFLIFFSNLYSVFHNVKPSNKCMVISYSSLGKLTQASNQGDETRCFCFLVKCEGNEALSLAG